MKNRRSFLKKITAAGAALIFTHKSIAEGLHNSLRENQFTPPESLASDEDFWSWVQQSYTVDTNILNFNNGGVSPQPKVVQDAWERMNEYANQAPSYYMWRIMDQGREPLRERLALLAGCNKEEIAINRNASESLETIIFGLNLLKGDEVIYTKQDYPNMIHAYRQRELREGIKLVALNFDLPIDDDDKIVKAYTDAFTDKTRLVHITHVINWTGQIMPVAKIAAAAHKKGIEVVVDGAHSFAHLDFKIPDLGCDYFGTSLHKWLGAPFGTGMMYIRKEKIKTVWPLLANDKPNSEDIRKFEVLGTRSFATEQAIGNAIAFHEIIGTKRKEERLRYLKNYWCNKVKDIPGLKFNTTFDPKKSCAIANVRLEGMEVGELESALFSKYKIHTSPINWENIHGVRITPNVYTTIANLDHLVSGLTEIAQKK